MIKQYFYVSVFAIAMAFLETSVVIYLRELMYPEGFRFPLVPINPEIAITELLREAATLIMLVMIGILSGRKFSDRFAWFLYGFAIWDIFYYVFLKVMIDWPESFMTWDILFLIPSTWTGPVIAPVIVSLLMILLASQIIYFSGKKPGISITLLEWVGLISGSLILILGFIWDYSKFILNEYTVKEMFSPINKEPLFELSIQYVPYKFPWVLFVLGISVILLTILKMNFRWKKEEK